MLFNVHMSGHTKTMPLALFRLFKNLFKNFFSKVLKRIKEIEFSFITQLDRDSKRLDVCRLNLIDFLKLKRKIIKIIFAKFSLLEKEVKKRVKNFKSCHIHNQFHSLLKI